MLKHNLPLCLLLLAAGCTPSAAPDVARHTEQPVAETTARADPAKMEAAASEKPRPKRRVRKPFDPIRDNGPIFVGWPKPRLAIVITGRQDGYLEPCGCAGLDRMRGGLGRRHAMIQSLRKQDWPLVLLDAGGLSKFVGPQAMLKFRVAVEGMTRMGYDAIGLGTAELRFPAAELLTLLADEEARPSRFLSANVGLFGPAGRVIPQQRTIEAGGVKVCVVAVLGKEYQRELHNPDVELTDPEVALAALVPARGAGVSPAHSDVSRAKAGHSPAPQVSLNVLLSHATKDESMALARRFPVFDVVVTTDGPPVPPAEPIRIEGSKTLLISVGEKVKDAVVLGLFDDSRQPLRYQRVPLDSRFLPTSDMKALMTRYQEDLRQVGLQGLGVRPVPHPLKAVQGDFVGSEKCATCHEASYKAWKKSKHAKATQTLGKLDPPRQFDPECLACHVTGWHPGGFFPYEGGYSGLEATPTLAAVGCESCHGPCGAHAAAEDHGDKALQQRLRTALVLDQARARQQVCAGCHDVNNSPDFEFDAYWPDVEHREDQ